MIDFLLRFFSKTILSPHHNSAIITSSKCLRSPKRDVEFQVPVKAIRGLRTQGGSRKLLLVLCVSFSISGEKLELPWVDYNSVPQGTSCARACRYADIKTGPTYHSCGSLKSVRQLKCRVPSDVRLSADGAKTHSSGSGLPPFGHI